jgi:hypothetical protein
MLELTFCGPPKFIKIESLIHLTDFLYPQQNHNIMSKSEPPLFFWASGVSGKSIQENILPPFLDFRSTLEETPPTPIP